MNRGRLVTSIAAALLLGAGCAHAGGGPAQAGATAAATGQVPGAASGGVHLVAVGDIAAADNADAAVARRVAALDPQALLLLGDVAYPKGSTRDFARYFTPDWGRFASIWMALPGNHEYRTPGAAGYREYFGETGGLYWSQRVGSWAVIALDSERPKSAAQLAWLSRTLAKFQGVPTLVAWHRPRYSSGMHGDQPDTSALWKAVSADPDVKLVLWGHDHDYERLEIPVKGRRPLPAMIVGTGGGELRATPAQPNRAMRKVFVNGVYGVLDLRLRRTGLSWAFVTDSGQTLDSGSLSF